MVLALVEPRAATLAACWVSRFKDKPMANTIAALLHGRDNNFNLIRFIAASAVLLDHCFALVAPDQAANAFIDVEGLGIGRLAVDVFFIVSGFLVTRSVMTQPTLVDYAVARFLRLFPALLAACIFIAFVLGPLVTLASWHDYFTDPRVWLFVPLTASLVTHSMTLPGVFDSVPQKRGDRPAALDPALRDHVLCPARAVCSHRRAHDAFPRRCDARPDLRRLCLRHLRHILARGQRRDR
jgi:hypothetical protein